MHITLNKANQDNLDLFARIAPIVGDALLKKHITIVGDSLTTQLLEYLVSCGITNFDYFPTSQDSAFRQTIVELSSRLKLEIQFQINTKNVGANLCVFPSSSLIVGGGGYKEYEIINKLVKQSGKLGLFYSLLANDMGLIIFLFPDKTVEIPKNLFSLSPQNSFFSQLHLINVVANYVKGLLLKGSIYERLDIENLINSTQLLLVGHPSWPWVIKPLQLKELTNLIKLSTSLKITNSHPELLGKTCLIVGLGSLGSVVAETFAKLGANLVLVDGEKVDFANPIRQIYRVDQVGKLKTDACIEQINNKSKEFSKQKFFSYNLAISSENLFELEELLSKHKIDVAIIATGTGTDRIISQVLREQKIPQVIVSCYARARFFEAIVIDSEKSPCFGCVRGHLYLGSAPSLTPEQKMHYVSTEHDLTAEPATRIETGRAANLAAHIAYSLLNLETSKWLARALKEEQTFFLGGNTAEEQSKDDWVYGIELPGEVKLFGLQDITGRGNYIECWDCGRKLPVKVFMETKLLFNE